MDNVEHGRHVLIDYSLGPEALTAVGTVIVSVLMNRRLLKAGHNRKLAKLVVVALPIITLVVAVGLGMLISGVYLKSYTSGLH